MNNIVKKLDRAEKSGIVNMIIKPVSLLLSLAYTPLLLEYLGDEKYGLWATVLSIISWINYFDVGIGNGLRNVLTKDLTEKKYKHAQKAVSTAYIVLTGISGTILFLLIILTFSLDWYNIFSTQVDMSVTLLVTFVFICINFILSLSNTVLYALQLSERVSIRGCLIQVFNIIGLLFLREVSSGNLVYLAILFGSTTFVVNIINTAQIVRYNSFLKPSFSEFDKDCISGICNIGLKFFVIQIMCMLMFTMDNIIITHFWGAEVVTPFSVANKIFNTGYSFLAAFLVPYWSGTTVAIAQGDTTWMKKSLKRIMIILFLFCIGCFGVTVVFKPLVRIWLHQELSYQPGIVITMCVFYILYAILTIECQFINGSGMLNVQLIMYLFLGIANVPFSIFLGVKCEMQTVGVRLATTILVAIADIVLGFNLRGIINKIEKKGEKA